MHPHEQHGERFWEEIRLLERITDDIRSETETVQVKKLNHFLNVQCEELSLGHSKCREMLENDPVLPAYENVEDYEADEPHVVGCYGCEEMYRTESESMPEEFENLREIGFIRVGGYNYNRTIES